MYERIIKSAVIEYSLLMTGCHLQHYGVMMYFCHALMEIKWQEITSVRNQNRYSSYLYIPYENSVWRFQCKSREDRHPTAVYFPITLHKQIWTYDGLRQNQMIHFN